MNCASDAMNVVPTKLSHQGWETTTHIRLILLSVMSQCDTNEHEHRGT